MDQSKALDHLVWYLIFRFKGDFRIKNKEHLIDIILGDAVEACQKIQNFDVKFFKDMLNE